VLRVFEAIRLYAANSEGKLPQRLNDITEVPVPNDPVTNEAFVYRRDPDKAFLEGPPLRDVSFHYEITMSQPQ
jgi:hypothetical protein